MPISDSELEGTGNSSIEESGIHSNRETILQSLELVEESKETICGTEVVEERLLI